MHGLLCAPARGVAPPAGLCQAVVQHMLWLEARFFIYAGVCSQLLVLPCGGPYKVVRLSSTTGVTGSDSGFKV